MSERVTDEGRKRILDYYLNHGKRQADIAALLKVPLALVAAVLDGRG